MGSCLTAGGRKRDDIGREIDAGVLEGQLSALRAGRELISGGSNSSYRYPRISEVRFNWYNRFTSIA